MYPVREYTVEFEKLIFLEKLINENTEEFFLHRRP